MQIYKYLENDLFPRNNLYAVIGKCRDGDKDYGRDSLPGVLKINNNEITICQVKAFLEYKDVHDSRALLFSITSGLINSFAVLLIDYIWKHQRIYIFEVVSLSLGVIAEFAMYKDLFLKKNIEEYLQYYNHFPDKKLARLEFESGFINAINTCEYFYKNYINSSKKQLPEIDRYEFFDESQKALLKCIEKTSKLFEQCDKVYGAELLDKLRLDLSQSSAKYYKLPVAFKHIPEFCIDRNYYPNYYQWNDVKFAFTDDAIIVGEQQANGQEL